MRVSIIFLIILFSITCFAETTGVITKIKGEVYILKDDEKIIKAKEKMTVDEKDLIRVQKKSFAKIKVNKKELELKENTTVSMKNIIRSLSVNKNELQKKIKELEELEKKEEVSEPGFIAGIRGAETKEDRSKATKNIIWMDEEGNPIVGEDQEIEEIKSLLANDMYSVVLEKVQDFIKKYPKSSKMGEVKLLLGKAYEGLGEKEKAKKIYEKIVKENPESDVCKEAGQRLEINK